MSSILYEVRSGVAYLTLNRPEKFNAFNREMALRLQESLDAAAADASVRCVCLTGQGKAFCSGQDLGEVTGENPMPFAVILREHYNPIIARMRRLPKPVVCAVNGVAAGAGANIALAADITVASDQASFIQAFSKIGLIPDSGGTYFLPRLVGQQRAAALMMLGDKVSAAEAERMGMISRVVPAGSFATEVERLCETLASMPTRALALTKEALNASAGHSWEEQLECEDRLQQQAARTEDYQEGVNAFLQKRTPRFTGK